jgi:hypothetical protein
MDPIENKLEQYKHNWLFNSRRMKNIIHPKQLLTIWYWSCVMLLFEIINNVSIYYLLSSQKMQICYSVLPDFRVIVTEHLWLLFLFFIIFILGFKNSKFLTSKYFNDFNWHCNLEYLMNYILRPENGSFDSETCRRFNWLPSKNN